MHTQRAVRFGSEDAQVPVGSHICLLYRTEEERDRIAVPFVREGVRDGASCRYVVDDQTAEHLRRGLAAAGVNVENVEASGHLQILTAAETYLKKAPFDYREMLAFWDVVVDHVRDAKLPYSRCAGETAFLQQKGPGLERFMEYEAHLNNYIPNVPLVVLCLYNLTKLSGDLVAGVLQTHPYAVMGGVLIRNPYYIPPEQFLAQHKPTNGVCSA
ncbi:MAG TPA: MEDS domain-containing protein [Terriglobales bacterium]|nr:MEDS domain-containing protein [Terriglobales bacterium]